VLRLRKWCELEDCKAEWGFEEIRATDPPS
jgi:hypothetical protein